MRMAPEYELTHHQRVENQYVRLYEDIGLGLTTWSLLASALLSCKYPAACPNAAAA